MLEDVGVFHWIEKRHEGLLDGLRADDVPLVGVFHVEDQVADVVGGLHHVGQGVPGINQVLVIDLGDAALFHGLFKDLEVGIEDVVFLAVSFVVGRIGVFDQGAQGGGSQRHASWTASIELTGQQVEGVGIALERSEVAPLLGKHGVL